MLPVRIVEKQPRARDRPVSLGREQFGDASVRVGWQAPEHVFDVCPGDAPFYSHRIDQVHHGCGTFARASAASEQPVVAANGDGPDVALDPIVVHGPLPSSAKRRFCNFTRSSPEPQRRHQDSRPRKL